MSGRVDSNSHAAAIARVTEAGKYAPELREHLEQIIRSSAFKGSHRSQIFLTHVVERSLGGDSESLRERTIGMELFGRPADYDTGEDAIVRVTASDVRRRLLQFYGNPIGGGRVRIEIPSGAYLPEYRFLSASEPAAPAPVPAERSVEIETAVVAVPTAPVMAPAAPVASRRPRRWQALAVAAIALVLAGGLAGWFLGRRWTRPLPNDFISSAFQGPSRSVQVIISDEALVLIQVILNRRYTLQQYEDLDYLNAPELEQDPNLQRLRKRLSTMQLANIGDLQNAGRMKELLRARDWDVAIRHARQMNARDFRNGNFILLGGSFSNPWANLFRVQDSNFPMEDPPAGGKAVAYLNPHPAPGQPPSFGVGTTPEGKVFTHARVSLVQNVTHSGRVLWVAGQSVSATELAGEFLSNGESVGKVRTMLGLSANSPLPDLEMILRVTEVNNVGDSVQLVACRKFPRHSD